MASSLVGLRLGHTRKIKSWRNMWFLMLSEIGTTVPAGLVDYCGAK